MKKIVMASLIAATAAQNAGAVDFKAGEWTVGVGGIVNAYYTQVSCSGAAVGGLALAGKGLGCGGQDDRATIGNGLLPNALVTSASSRLGGYDVKALVGIFHATATDSAIAQNSNVDVRQAYFTFGNEDIGTFKLGRDNGIFGSAAILGDMTLVGAGAPVQATQRGRVALGHIGAGYSYMGYYGQVAWSAPKRAGFGIDVALVSPVADTPILAASRYGTKTSPQLQGQLTYTSGALKAWLGAKTQKFESATAGVQDFTMNAFEVGASYNDGPFGLLANYQAGKGLGVLSDADQAGTKARNCFVQATYKATDQLKVGVGHGVSKNSDNNAATFGLESNANTTVGAYYALNSAITLVAEVGQTRSKAFSGGSARMNGAALGGIIFF